jgi:hypothetical protein
MDESILNQFGIPVPGNESVPSGTPANKSEVTPGPSNTDSVDSRLNELFGQAQDIQPKPSEVKPVEANEKPVEIVTPPPSTQPVSVVTDPTKVFADGSPKAFFTKTGDLDSVKINDYFLTNGKSFMKYAVPTDEQPAAVPVKSEEKPDPIQEYRAKVDELIDKFELVLEDQKTKGFTEAQALLNINEYLISLKTRRDNRLEVKKSIEEAAKEFSPDLEDARNNRINSQIYKNTTELSQGLDDLIPGMKAMDVFNQFVLNLKYGGAKLDWMFKRENPGVMKLSPEERDKVGKEWFRKFQTDKEALAHVAEFGRLRWQVENFKPILEHAQQVGAQKVQNKSEAAIGGPSNIVPFQKLSKPSIVDQFFGVTESVN